MSIHPFPTPSTGPPSVRDATCNVKLWSITRVISMARLGFAPAATELQLRAAMGDFLAKLELRHGTATRQSSQNG